MQDPGLGSGLARWPNNTQGEGNARRSVPPISEPGALQLDTLARGDATYNFVKLSSLRSRGSVLHNAPSDMPGISVFAKDECGAIFRTYSTYGRGLDMMNTAYHYLDLVPKGRDEAGLPHTMAWVKLRDLYDR